MTMLANCKDQHMADLTVNHRMSSSILSLPLFPLPKLLSVSEKEENEKTFKIF